jgi:hypothetical protein
VSLYKKVKDHLPATNSVISDDEFILLHRKDYHLSQVSAINALLIAINVNCSYTYRVLLSNLEQYAINCPTDDFNIVVADPALALAAFTVWVRAGGSASNGKVYAPRGVPQFPDFKGPVGDLVAEFKSQTETLVTSKPSETRRHLFTFVLGNTKDSGQTLFAVDRFVEAELGLLMLKDYARTDAADEREYLETKRVFPSISFEGHAIALKLRPLK